MWRRIKKFFLHSETIFMARLQVFIGTFLIALVGVDPTIFTGLTGKWFPVFLVVHGALAEYLRKRRDTEIKSRGE